VPRQPLCRCFLLLPLAASAISIAAVTGCGTEGDAGGSIQQPNPVASVTVTVPSTGAAVQVGQTLQLTATAKDADGVTIAVGSYQWASADESIATVSSGGLVTGVAEGQTEITATTDGVSGSATVTVSSAPPPPPPPPPGTDVPGLQQIASGLKFPTGIVSPPGDTRLFVLLKAGPIRIIKDGNLLPAPFIDLTAKVSSPAGEQGLLGLAFPPDYATSGRLYVHYNDKSNTNRVSALRVSADPDQADPGSESEVLAFPQPGVAHNGGQLAFGPDGMLYVGLGDGDDSDHGRGQSLADPFANIMRIDVSTAPYTVPPDNPFVGTAGARPEIWSYGFRNPWRFSFDRVTGDLYVGDVGESDWEEIDYASAAGGNGKGLNYGWDLMQGMHCFRIRDCDPTGLTPPVLEYSHAEGCAVVSGFVYRGTAMPSLQGTYFYADYCSGWVRSLKIVGGVPTEQREWPDLKPGGQITSLGEDSAGELYIVTQQGGVYKIVKKG
jgi:glucose/arabinose dehydrogenase